jgi:hypothetical protein
MIKNYKTKAAKKSRSQQRREAVQKGKKLPTFTGKKISTSKRDPHVHLTPAAHATLTAAQKRGERHGLKPNLKLMASEAIQNFWKAPR